METLWVAPALGAVRRPADYATSPWTLTAQTVGSNPGVAAIRFAETDSPPRAVLDRLRCARPDRALSSDDPPPRRKRRPAPSAPWSGPDVALLAPGPPRPRARARRRRHRPAGLRRRPAATPRPAPDRRSAVGCDRGSA